MSEYDHYVGMAEDEVRRATIAREQAERKLAAASNYVADREVDPTCVWIAGRRISLKTEVRGGRIVRAWLDVSPVGVVSPQHDGGQS